MCGRHLRQNVHWSDTVVSIKGRKQTTKINTHNCEQHPELFDNK